MSNQRKDTYEGMFTPNPDEAWTDIFGRPHEIHRNPLGPDVKITRDWFGKVVEIKEDGWF